MTNNKGIINNIFKYILFNYSMGSIIPKYFKKGVHQMLKVSLNLVCQSPGGAQTANLHSPPHPTPPLLSLISPPKTSKWLQDCKFKGTDRLCFMEVKFSKIKVRVHTAWSPLYHLTQQQANLKGAEQGSLHRLFSHSCPFPELRPQPSLSLEKHRGETHSAPADYLFSRPMGCSSGQPTLILTCQIWDGRCGF